jgi:hypothetical protein
LATLSKPHFLLFGLRNYEISRNERESHPLLDRDFTNLLHEDYHLLSESIENRLMLELNHAFGRYELVRCRELS